MTQTRSHFSWILPHFSVIFTQLAQIQKTEILRQLKHHTTGNLLVVSQNGGCFLRFQCFCHSTTLDLKQTKPLNFNV